MCNMRLWTYHASTFCLLTATRVDPSKGHGHVPPHERDAYLTARQELCLLLGTDQFLFCCVTDDPFVRMDESEDLLEWRIEMPSSEVMKLVRCDVWNRIRVGKTRVGDWDRLFFEHPWEDEATRDELQALVSFPIPTQYLTRIGKAPVQNSKEARQRKRGAR